MAWRNTWCIIIIQHCEGVWWDALWCTRGEGHSPERGLRPRTNTLGRAIITSCWRLSCYTNTQCKHRCHAQRTLYSSMKNTSMMKLNRSVMKLWTILQLIIPFGKSPKKIWTKIQLNLRNITLNLFVNWKQKKKKHNEGKQYIVIEYMILLHDVWDIECNYGFLECQYRAILHGSTTETTTLNKAE